MGLLQGIEPALSGVANPAVSPRAAEVKFISHHALPLIAGSVLAGDRDRRAHAGAAAARRRNALSPPRELGARPGRWCSFGGIAVALVSIGHQVLSAILTQNSSIGHDFSEPRGRTRADEGHGERDQRLPRPAGGARARGGDDHDDASATMRVGLLTRWVGVLGIFRGDPDLPADRRRDARARARLLDGRDGPAVCRALAGRRPAGLDPGRSTSMADRAADAARRASRRRRRASPEPAAAEVVPAPARPGDQRRLLAQAPAQARRAQLSHRRSLPAAVIAGVGRFRE